MKNAEKYKTAQERAEKFREFCDAHDMLCEHNEEPCLLEVHADGDRYGCECFAYWLDLEPPGEKPLPCPFCGSEVKIQEIDNENKEAVEFYVHCDGCHVTTMDFATREELLSMWNNRVARAVMAAKEVAK